MRKTARGESSPANPALVLNDPVSMTNVWSSSSSMIHKNNSKQEEQAPDLFREMQSKTNKNNWLLFGYLWKQKQ